MAAPQYLGGSRLATSGEARLIAQLTQAGWTVVYLLWSTDMLNPVRREVGANLPKPANPKRDVQLLSRASGPRPRVDEAMKIVVT